MFYIFSFLVKFVSINIKIMNYRIERDTMGEVRVPADKLWGAQTETISG